MVGDEVLGDPGEQGRLGEAEHVAGRPRRPAPAGDGGGREQVGAVAEHAQVDEPPGGVVDQLGHVVGQDLDGEPIAVGLRQGLDQRLALGRRRLAGDGGGRDAAEQGVDRLADQGAAQLRAELRQPQHRQVAERLIDRARDGHRRLVDQALPLLGRGRAAEQALRLQGVEHDPRLGHGVLEPELPLGPDLVVAEVDDRLDHVERRRVGRRLGPARLADDLPDLGEAAEHLVADPQVVAPPRRSRRAARWSACP